MSEAAGRSASERKPDGGAARRRRIAVGGGRAVPVLSSREEIQQRNRPFRDPNDETRAPAIQAPWAFMVKLSGKLGAMAQ